ncbi:MAG: L-2-amino-thiazoline-4-carboxylic acid hydrolase [Candidatus Hodarchaeales archaeon]|jgi:hypothetical protein
MKIESYRTFNPKVMVKVDLLSLMDQSLYELESMLKFVFDNKPDQFKQYLFELKRIFSSYIQDYTIKSSSLNIDNLKEDLSFIFNHSEIISLSLKVICLHLEIPMSFQFDDRMVDVILMKEKSTASIFKYLGIKAMQELLNEDDGLKFYKKYCQIRYQDTGMKKNPRTAKQAREDQLKEFSDQGLYDWKFAIFDDEKYLLKVNRCFFHEVFKPFNDPKVSYLACCYTGSDAIRRDNQYLRMRRTQTLFDGDFCDEFYWNKKVYDQPEQPNLEFTRKLN